MEPKLGKLEEAALRSATMQKTVDVVNAFNLFLNTPTASPAEDQAEAAVDEVVNRLLDDGHEGLAGHVILGLCSMLAHSADPQKLQEFLDLQSEMIAQLAEEGAEEEKRRELGDN